MWNTPTIRSIFLFLLSVFAISEKSKSGPTDFWTGRWHFGESWSALNSTGIGEYVIYELDIRQANNHLVGNLTGNGFMTLMRVDAEIKPIKNGIQVILGSVRADDMSSKAYVKGDVLFELIREKNRVITRWKKLKANLDENKKTDVHFVKFPTYVEVPAKIVNELKKDEVYADSIVINPDGTAKNLVAEETDLNRDAIPEIIVHGIGNICGANNCIHWIFRKAATGYELLLREDAVQMVEPQRSYTKGYRDIIMAQHSSATESYLTLFKFDGRKYKVDSCYVRRFDWLIDRHGELRLGSKGQVQYKKQPTITRIKCGEDK